MPKVKTIIIAAAGLIGGGYALYKGFNKSPSKYSLEWIKGLSDVDWEKEREAIRKQMCNPELDTAFREKCRTLLRLFDDVKSAMDWAGRTPCGPAYHGEHGTNLYKPD